MNIYIRILTIISVLFCTSCSNWLDVDQEGEIEAEKLFENGDGYRVALNGLYKAMGTANLYGNNLSFGMVDCMSQQYNLADGANEDALFRSFADFRYKDNNVVGIINGMWLSAFKIIANANDLIQRTANAPQELFEYGEMERSLILGESYACRALMHFEMLRLFAPAPINADQETYVPYVEDYPNTHPASIQVAPFLDKVIRDLVKAKELVAAFDTSDDGKKINSTPQRRFSSAPNNFDYGDFFAGRAYRLSYYSITALLARVYQYAGKEKEAFDCAKEVLEYGKNEGNTFYYDDFEGVQSGVSEEAANTTTPEMFDQKSDLKTKSNVIFAAYNKDGYKEWTVNRHFNSNATLSSGKYYFPIDRAAIFSSRVKQEWRDDYRSKYMVYVPTHTMYFISGKWYVNSTNPEKSEHLKFSPVIRLTEMKYIMAEYFARQNQYTEAYGILNDIRRERGLNVQLEEQTRFEEFIVDLVEDARREWISEGQLFYLYKRLNAAFVKDGKTHRLTKGEACLPLPADQK